MATTHTLFTRAQPLPALIAQTGSWFAESVTTPDVVAMNAQLHCYVGAVTGGHERIVVLKLKADALRIPVAMTGCPAWLAIDVGPTGQLRFRACHGPGGRSDRGACPPILQRPGLGPDSIGLATSADGVTFAKFPERILPGRAPEISVHESQFFLFYVRQTLADGYAIHLATSMDGVVFHQTSPRPVLDKGREGSWDSHTVTTPRVFARDGFHYMLYAGDSRRRDEPHGFGLARSRDLVSWTRYARNPVFRRGRPGAWDDGAIWFGTVFEWNDTLYLFYEGTSRAALKNATNTSAVGVAICRGATFDRCMADWRSE